VCWTYASDEAWREAAVAWLEDGVRLGLKLLLTADARVEELVEDLAALPDRDALLASGQLAVAPLRAVYDLDVAIDPVAQVAVYAAAVQAAQAEGYAGLRAVSDGTPLAADPYRLTSLLRWELHADRWIASGVPMSCLCTLDVRRVAPDALHDVLRVHPCVHHEGRDVPFQVSGGDGALAVDGEVDRFDADALAHVLALVPGLGEQVVDLSRLTFADHRAVLELGRAVQAAGGPVVIRGATPALRRMWGLLGLPEAPVVEWAA
jgi:hypothetical protein